MRDQTAKVLVPEILVHITAPSRGTDDARYRRLAQAYLGFETTTQHPIIYNQTSANKHHSGNLDSSSSQIHGERTTIDSPNLSFQSAFGNLGSPRPQQPNEGFHDSQSSWVAPPSIIQESVPNDEVAFRQFCSPTRILEHYISTFDSSQSISPISQNKSQLEGAVLGRSNPSQEETRRFVDGIPPDPTCNAKRDGCGSSAKPHPCAQLELEGRCSSPSRLEPRPPSTSHRGTVIPGSPVRRTRRAPASPALTSFVEETRIASSFPPQVALSSSRADSEPPAKRVRTSPPLPGRVLARSSSDGPRQEQLRTQKASNSLDHLEILAPDPPTSLQDLRPSDMVTETLLDLAQRVDLGSRYRPQLQTRALRLFERGYWMVDCASWEQDLKDSAWEFLTDYLRNGLVGWGAMCKRNQTFTFIRLYCFGCVVEYMFLVIWVASKRRVRKCPIRAVCSVLSFYLGSSKCSRDIRSFPKEDMSANTSHRIHRGVMDWE